MNDPEMKVIKADERTMDVNDINGRNSHIPLSRTMDRVVPIKPRMMEYDIINPVSKDASLRMSAYGKNVLSSRQ